MKTALALAVLLAAAPAAALDRWTWQDTAWEGAFLTTLALDWRQTITIARYPNLRGNVYEWDYSTGTRSRPAPVYEHHELNPILGRHPSEAAVNRYFLASALAHAGVAMVLPSRWRRAWQGLGIGWEGFCVGRNVHLGIRMTF